jgi:hypothetical protein
MQLFWQKDTMGKTLAFYYKAGSKSGNIGVYSTIWGSLTQDHGVHAGSLDWVDKDIYEVKRKEALKLWNL